MILTSRRLVHQNFILKRFFFSNMPLKISLYCPFSKYRYNAEKPVFFAKICYGSETWQKYRSLCVVFRNARRIFGFFQNIGKIQKTGIFARIQINLNADSETWIISTDRGWVKIGGQGAYGLNCWNNKISFPLTVVLESSTVEIFSVFSTCIQIHTLLSREW